MPQNNGSLCFNCRSLFATHYHQLSDEYQNNPSVALKHMACHVQPREDGPEQVLETCFQVLCSYFGDLVHDRVLVYLPLSDGPTLLCEYLWRRLPVFGMQLSFDATL